MRSSLPVRVSFALTAAFSVSLATTASAEWASDQPASAVLGQTSFTTNDPHIATTSASTTYAPSAVCVDRTNAKVYVVDSYNNRVLRFSGTSALVTGSAAEGVLGQPNLETRTDGLSQAGMKKPTSCAVGPAGALYVGDEVSRVLRYDSAHTKANGANADGVLGAATFDAAGTSGASADRLGGSVIYGLAVGSNGALYVVDRANHRVLRFDAAATKANGADANGVLGQGDFDTATSGLSATKFSMPQGVAIDPDDNLFVLDTLNSRVLRFDNAKAKADGAAADGVLGAPDLMTVGGGATMSRFGGNYMISADPDGGVYVSDYNSHRVLVFKNAKTKANGADADFLLGKGIPATHERAFNNPLGIGFDGQGHAFVADYNNNRVLVFTYGAGAGATVPGAPVIGEAAPGNRQATVTFAAPASNGGSAIIGYTVKSDPPGGVDSDLGKSSLIHVVTGLNNGTSYTFTVTATNAVGTSLPSASSNSVIPSESAGPNVDPSNPDGGITLPGGDGGAALASADDDGGCSCHAVGGNLPSSALLSGLALFGFGVARRIRRARRS